MPRKRNVTGETAATEIGPEALSEGSAPKISPGRRTVRSAPRKITGGAKKPRAGRAKAIAPQPQPAEMQAEDTLAQSAQVETNQPVPAAASQSESSVAPLESAEATLSSAVSAQEQIALLAYSYWEARGRQHGNAEEDWYRAEREILSRLQSTIPEP
jgi:hypothetical protein